MKIQNVIKYVINPVERFMINSLRGLYNSWSDEKYIKKEFKLRMGYDLNLDNPKTLIEKMQWLKINNRKPEMTMLVDKYKVRKYIADQIGEQYLIPSLGVWNSAEEINFDLLPNQFVLKCNHNSGLGMCVCKNKNKLNINETKKSLSKGLRQDYYLIGREWPYKNVERKIVGEVYLENADKSPLVDYKFYCFGGKPRYFMYSIGEAEHNVRNHKFDMELNSIDYLFKKNPALNEADINLPSNIHEMISIVEKLCRDFPHIRVDLYNIDGKIYFGELTFYTNSGYINIDSEEYAQKMADYIILEV